MMVSLVGAWDQPLSSINDIEADDGVELIMLCIPFIVHEHHRKKDKKDAS
jgi:hypothetical protein